MRRRRGFSIIEFVVASVLIAAALAGSAAGIAGTSRALAIARASDFAAARAFSALEAAAAFSCQSVTVPTANAVAAAENRCRLLVDDGDGVADETLVSGSYSSDLTWTVTNEGRVYTFVLSTRYMQTGVPAGTCTSARLLSQQLDAQLPSLLERKVQVSWSVLGRAFTKTVSSVTAVPTTSFDISTGSLIVYAAAGSTVSIRQAAGTTWLSRIASACNTGRAGATGAAWFPFLPAGSYIAVGPSGVSVTVSVNGAAAPTAAQL